MFKPIDLFSHAARRQRLQSNTIQWASCDTKFMFIAMHSITYNDISTSMRSSNLKSFTMFEFYVIDFVA